MQEHQDPGQLRAARHFGRDPGIRASVRAQAERSDEPIARHEAVFNQAVDEVTAAAERLIQSLQIKAPPRNREEERIKARERARKRFA